MHENWRELADSAYVIAQNGLNESIGTHWHHSVASALAVSNHNVRSLAH